VLVPVNKLLTAIKFAKAFTSRDLSLPVLTSVYFRELGGELVVVSTNRYQASVFRMGVDAPGGFRMLIAVPVVDAHIQLARATGANTINIDRLTAVDGEFPDVLTLMKVTLGREQIAIPVGSAGVTAALLKDVGAVFAALKVIPRLSHHAPSYSGGPGCLIFSSDHAMVMQMMCTVHDETDMAGEWLTHLNTAL